MIEDQESKVNH